MPADLDARSKVYNGGKWRFEGLSGKSSVKKSQTRTLSITVVEAVETSVATSELDFYIWNANWPMKCEAKMAAYGGQFCTSVLVSYTVMYVKFSLSRDIFHFHEEFSLKIYTK